MDTSVKEIETTPIPKRLSDTQEVNRFLEYFSFSGNLTG